MSAIAWVWPAAQAGRAAFLLVAALVILAAVWILQGLGYAPCELCLTERYAFYANATLALIAAYLANRGAHGIARGLFILVALVFLVNAGLAFYHVGVEEHWWPGPSACTGALNAPVDVKDLAQALNSSRIVRCDEAALRILGVSLAGWDVVASAALALYAALAARAER
ncbi:MAG: disulfide bond formation protein B [Hyphomicrobiales bacterium]|nr:disulfide bond formation protein B [Hyphomicrobiales bacterium]